MRNTFVMRRHGARTWLLSDPATSADVGGIEYVHAADGNHYRPWVIVNGLRRDAGAPVPQLPMAARAVESAAKSPDCFRVP